MRVRILAAIAAVMMLAAACGSSSPTGNDSNASDTSVDASPAPIAEQNEEAAAPDQAADPSGAGRTNIFPLSDVSAVPSPDTEITDVELADVIFDTFGGPPLTLADSTDAERRALFDVIPPLDEPQYDAIGVDDWLEDADVVLGYITPGGVPIAFPHKILNFHELVNDEFDGLPVLISYCPLCGSGVVYDRRPDDLRQTAPLAFSNTSALYENDLVMVDRETGSYWWQSAGKSLLGILTGAELPVLPSSTARWDAWREAHPDTLVLSRNTGFSRDYTRASFAGYSDRVDQGLLPFPASPETLADDRLPSSTIVVAVELDDASWAVPLNELAAGSSVELGASGVRVEMDSFGVPTAVNADGAAVPNRTSMWFALLAVLPDVEVVHPG